MDPDANLDALLELVNSVLDGHADVDDDYFEVCELVQAMDGWISNGGFLPKKWRKD